LKGILFMVRISIILFLLLALSLPTWAASYSIQDITWTQGVNVTISGNSLTSSGASTWNSGAFSSQSLAANINGYIEMTVQETNTHRMLGFSSDNPDAYWSSIEYALYLVANAQIYIYENGAGRGYYTSYATGDIVGLRRDGGVIKYYKNGVVFYTSTINYTGILYADASLYETGSTIKSAKIAVEVVPEPASLALLLLGLISVWVYRKR